MNVVERLAKTSLFETHVSMPKKPERKSHLTTVREALRLSQPQFAERLAVSASIIKKVEEGKRAGSDELKARIYAETGLWFFNKDEAPHLATQPCTYTKADHAAWMEEVQFDQKYAKLAAHVVLKLVELMLVAAARPGVQKSFQVYTALLMAVERVKNEFHIEKHIEAEMRDRHMTETGSFTVHELRASRDLAKLWNFQDDPKRKGDETLLLEKTTGWYPTKEIQYALSKHRDMVSRVFKTQSGELSNEAKANLAALDQNIRDEIHREMKKFIRPESMIKKPPPP